MKEKETKDRISSEKTPRKQVKTKEKPATQKKRPSAGKKSKSDKYPDVKFKSAGVSKESKKTPSKKMQLLKKLTKIENLPKTVQDSIPFRGFTRDGVVETSPGVFTKCYKLKDVNFQIATADDQVQIFNGYRDLLNSFDPTVRWEFTIFNHEVDKRETLKNIKIAPQRDGLNQFRQEYNQILLNAMKKGNNSIVQDKYLTVAVEDINEEHAISTLNKLDGELNIAIRRISKAETHPMSSLERMQLLYNIYNQDFDYRMITGVDENGKEIFDMNMLAKSGLSVKDMIGPNSFDFSSGKRFMIGDTYGQALYLDHVGSQLSTKFMSDLSDIQTNMLISTTYEAIDNAKAMKIVKNRLSEIEQRAVEVQQRNSNSGYFGALPPEIEKAQDSARGIMNELMNHDQKLFLMTMTVVVFARTVDQLNEFTRMVKTVASRNLAPIKVRDYQQEMCLNTALPLCRNDLIQAERLYTTDSVAIFIPYNSEDLIQKNAIYYGLNQTTKSMILYDRLTGNNYNGLIFGYSGSGKSFTAKAEMVSVLLGHPNSQVFVVDPQGEYAPFVHAFGGQEINLSPGGHQYINPLDLDITENDEAGDPITAKSDFIISMFGIIVGRNRPLSPLETAMLDKATRKIYQAYTKMLEETGKTVDISQCPTLSDLYHELKNQAREREEAGTLADILYQYAVGSFDTFAHQTNVNTNARLVVYNTKNLGTGMKELGLYISTNDILNRMIANSKNDIYTWFYIDEFHILLESPGTTLFLKRVWKIARKWLGVPTGIMQNTEDLLRNADTRAIINNTSFVIMLKEPMMDRDNLAQLFNLSAAQLDYITDSDPGHGLIYNGKVVLPFANEFPRKGKLYSIMTTSHDVEGAEFK